MIDLVATFRNTLKQWGHDILLQRRLNDNMLYSARMEKTTVRSYNAQLTGQTNSLMENIEGLNVNSEMIYYFDSLANPKSGDRIYEEYPTGVQIFMIDQATPVKGRMGKTVYWVVGATRESPS
jgi:hypothetical protein